MRWVPFLVRLYPRRGARLPKYRACTDWMVRTGRTGHTGGAGVPQQPDLHYHFPAEVPGRPRIPVIRYPVQNDRSTLVVYFWPSRQIPVLV